MKQLTVTLGMVTRDHKDISPKEVREYLAQRFAGLSIVWGEGLWKGEWEPCYTLTIGYDSPEDRGVVMGKILSLARATNQEVVYLQGQGILPVPYNERNGAPC